MTVLFQVQGFDPIEVPTGTTMLDACDEHGIPMESACGGFAGCNSCRVTVLEGVSEISERQPEEIPFLDHEDQRLGCQAAVHGAVRVRLDPGM